MRIFNAVLSLAFAGLVLPGAAAANYDFFGGFIPQGSATIDGRIGSGEWPEGSRITLYKFFGEDSKIDVYQMWDANYLYLAAEVEDYELWVDDYDPAQFWISTFDDDAVKWEFDLDRSRNALLQGTDRVFAVNASGSASRFDRGDGAGSTLGANLLDSIPLVATTSGVLNDKTFKTVTAATRDGGYVVEAAISWRNLHGDANAGAPADGTLIGMNFTQIEDDTGGSLDPTYYREWKRVYDEITRLTGEEGRPENWSEFSFSASSDHQAPGSLGTLTLVSTSPHSAKLRFPATGDNGESGYAQRYEIRYSTEALNANNWDQAADYPNGYRPLKSGSTETVEIIGLNPSTSYQVGVRAVDERGNRGAISTLAITTAAGGGSPGFITICPGQYYFCRQNGDAIPLIGDNQGMPWPAIRTFYEGQMWDEDQNRFRDFSVEEGAAEGEAYLSYLADHGVNTLRLIMESYDVTNPVYLFESLSGGPSGIVFSEETLGFIENFVDACAHYGINVIVTPFDTFYYSERWSRNPFNRANGGPLSSPSEFFSPNNRAYLTAIWQKVIDTVGDRENILAWELINEFDSDDPQLGWNTAEFDDREATVSELADYVRSADPNHLIFASSVRWDPKFTDSLSPAEMSSAPGADAALVLNNPDTDFNSTHTYYHNIRDPNYNDPNNRTTPYFTYEAGATDQDNRAAPAQWIKQGLQFYYANSLQPRPYIDTEAGPIVLFTPAYDSFFTEQDDNVYFLNTIWAHLATGDAGTGLRWPGSMLEGHALTDTMRDHQLAVSQFLTGDIDFAHFAPVPIGQRLEVSGTPAALIKSGVSDGSQGIVYLLKDTRDGAQPAVSGASLVVPELGPFHRYAFEFWSPSDTGPGPLDFQEISVGADGRATVNLPSFDTRLAVKFYSVAIETPSQGYLVTEDLWIRAVIDTVERGPIEAVWALGGDATTSRGDRVIWGHFYADPNDVSWGDPENPDLFVKIWFDVSGRVDVNYFHVSVPDIQVYSDYVFDGVVDAATTATTDTRYVRQYYQEDAVFVETQQEDGSAVPGDVATASSFGETAFTDLRIGAVIDTVELGPIEAVWRLGGQATTARGDQVMWGHFYASPTDVAWGSADNPDLFVKIWYDAGGRRDVNFFHVSVPDIQVFSDMPQDGTYDQAGRTRLENRYIRHEYNR